MSRTDPDRRPQLEREAYEPSWYRVLAGMSAGRVTTFEEEAPEPDPRGLEGDALNLAALEDLVRARSGGRATDR